MIRPTILLVVLATESVFGANKLHAAQQKLVLKDGWYIQASTNVPETSDTLSRPGFQPRNWYRAVVPSTVLAALVSNRVYADPYFGVNLRSIPGTEYPIGANFSNIPMPPGSPFRSSW